MCLKALADTYLYRCSFTFDPENFPDPKAYLAEIKRKYGVKICVWSKRASQYINRAKLTSLCPLSQPVYITAIPHL